MKQQVKQSEKSRVLSTKDYSLFEFPDVKLSTRFLEFIKDSLLDKNLMPDFPIVVDDEYRILDGKYKFIACYELKLPVYYKMAEVTTLTDVIRVKEISKKTPVKQILLAHKEKESYANILHLYDFFKHTFKYSEIISCVDGMVKNANSPTGWRWGALRRLMTDRYKLASGKLPQFDLSIVERRLTTVKYIVDEFGFDTSGALGVMFSLNWDVDFVTYAKYFRAAAKLAEGTNQSVIWEYNILMGCVEDENLTTDEMVNAFVAQRIKEWNEEEAPYQKEVLEKRKKNLVEPI